MLLAGLLRRAAAVAVSTVIEWLSVDADIEPRSVEAIVFCTFGAEATVALEAALADQV